MKRILITGANSYIGNSFSAWLNHYPEQYQVNTLDMRLPSWKEANFSRYDAVLHVAGLAHVSDGNITDDLEELYNKINRDLTIETAEKAKTCGVKQFIFMSSIIIYGESHISYKKVINRETKPEPDNVYGKSKLQAEVGLGLLSDDNFKVAVIRSPMVYGRGSKGNYPVLAKIARRSPAFPDIYNQRSMIHIDNLCEFIRLLIENEDRGIFFPQNFEYVKTSEMVKAIAIQYGKKIILLKHLTWIVRLLGFIPGRIGKTVNKAFGNLAYDMILSEYKDNYRIKDFYETIKETEEKLYG